MAAQDNSDITQRITDADIKLRKTLDLIMKMRIECAELQLRMLRLYSPEILNILERIEQKTTEDQANDEAGKSK